MNVKIKPLYPETALPKKGNPTDAGFDCYAHWVREVSDSENYVEYGLGFALEIPIGWCALVFPRSSISKYSLLLCNSVAIIDSGYRGELTARFKKTDDSNNIYKIGDKICQILFYKLPQVEFIETDELDNTNNRNGGFGSTGK